MTFLLDILELVDSLRYYELKAVRKIRYQDAWEEFVDTYNCPDFNFNRIIQTTLKVDEKLKVCAMNTVFDGDRIKKVDILFVYNMGIIDRANKSESRFYSYIPVTFDLEKKFLVVKVWNKDDTIDGDSPKEQLDFIFPTITIEKTIACSHSFQSI